uniref:Light-independent protochlorophyllide reductase subunit B n=1 Tax=Selaginella tamariscina TaxID=137178 RepID=A0A6C0U8H3_9TRAC|nr:protochlorophyllide reductase ChlB subunit [Selaginella tamariscina]
MFLTKPAHRVHAGPAHIGTPRIASSSKNAHATTHAPLGDDYSNVMRPALERDRDFTPVTASTVDRRVLARGGSQEEVVENTTQKGKEERPDSITPTPTCTSSIQEDLQHFVRGASITSDSDAIPADVNHYRVDESQAADGTSEQAIRHHPNKARRQGTLGRSPVNVPSANTIGTRVPTINTIAVNGNARYGV